MVDPRTVQVGAVLWALTGFAIAASALARVDGGAWVVLGLASVVFPACAVLAGVAVARGHVRAAGVFLLLSVATPTYFLWVVNLPALVGGVALLLAPRRVVAAY